MTHLKVFGTVFLLTIFVSIAILFFGFYSTGGARIDFSPGLDTGGGDVLGITVILSIILGGIFGSLIGALSAGYLIAIYGIFGELKMPIWTVLGYSILIGLLTFTFLFWQMTNEYPTYTLLVRDQWIGLIVYFLAGFFTALIPLMVAKTRFTY